MQSGDAAAVPAKENVSQEPEAPEGGMQLTQDQVKHIRENHISIELKDDTLIIGLTESCTSKDPCPCKPPKRVGFFSCHKAPCP